MALAQTVTLTSVQSTALLVGVPVGMFLLIALAVAAPGWVRKGRYRPGLGWSAKPVWFNRPEAYEPHEPHERDAATGQAGGAVGGARATW